MKGIVFTEFQEMVEDEFGFEVYDEIVESSDLPSGAAYTSVGTYSHTEMLSLVTRLSEKLKAPIPVLVKAFGGYFFKSLAKSHGKLLGGIKSSVQLLSCVEDYIHVEVRKLYSNAELPTFGFEQNSETQWTVDYSSTRPFADLAEGLIRASIEHFGDPIEVHREPGPSGDATSARFILTSKERIEECQIAMP